VVLFLDLPWRLCVPSLFQRLKQRKLVQWAVAYLAGAWLVTEVLDVIGERFHWPDWVLQGLIVLLAFGLPITLVLAWYHGEKGRQRVGGLELVLLAALLVAGGFAVSFIPRSAGELATGVALTATTLEFPEEVLARRIAILPLENLSPDPEADEYLVDGLHEEIQTQVSIISSLDVISRTSALQFKDRTGLGIREIGNSLAVGLVLDGSVRKAGATVRLAVQLVDTRTDRQLWANRYDRQLTATDLFEIQSDVALQIARAVEAQLTPDEIDRIEKQGTQNDQAYDAYLAGVFHLRAFEFLKAEPLLSRAVALDPDFANAHAQLALNYIMLGNTNLRPTSDVFPKALASAERAQELDEALFDTQQALVAINWSVERDWPEVERRLRRMISQNPSSSLAHNWLAQYLSLIGEHESAVDHAQRAWELDPLSWGSSGIWVGATLYHARRYEDAIRSLARLSEQVPGEYDPHSFLAISYALSGRPELAVQHARRAVQLHEAERYSVEPTVSVRLFLATILATVGQEAEARDILTEALRLRESEHVSAGYLALVHVRLGELEAAFEWLDTAREERDSWLFQLQDPMWDPIRADPRFRAFLTTLNLPEDVGSAR
jgi:TolB-like protein